MHRIILSGGELVSLNIKPLHNLVKSQGMIVPSSLIFISFEDLHNILYSLFKEVSSEAYKTRVATTKVTENEPVEMVTFEINTAPREVNVYARNKLIRKYTESSNIYAISGCAYQDHLTIHAQPIKEKGHTDTYLIEVAMSIFTFLQICRIRNEIL